MNSSFDKKALIAGVLDEGFHLRLQVTGASMTPFLTTGSYVTLAKTPVARLRIGDIVLCRCDDGSLKLHRLLAKKNDLLITKGDALWSPDRPFRKADYCGKAVRIEQHRGGSVIIRSMEGWPARLRNRLIALAYRFKLHLVTRRFAMLARLCESPG